MKDLLKFPLFTALITPLLEDGSVDYSSLLSLLKEQEQAKNGILILGSTGEALNLNDKDKKAILDFTLKQNLNVPIMAGVGGINLEETLEWVDYLETLPIDCYLLVTPLYAKPGPKGQTHWFKTLLDRVSRPSILYNVPSRTGVSLSFQTVKDLSSHKNFFGIKEASGKVEDFKKYKASAPNAKIYSGDDGMLPDFAPHGAFGLISVASNVWPEQTHKITQACIEGKSVKADLWKKICDCLFLVSNPVPAKILLYKLKRIKTPTLRPPLSHLEDFDHEKLMWANKEINEL
jgi:4-hydroxy-tetrahydrodipicolinate synthase